MMESHKDELLLRNQYDLGLYLCQLILKLSSVLKLLILTAKIPVRIKT
jgi:hypothetical protein